MKQLTIAETVPPVSPEPWIAITSGLSRSDKDYERVPVSKVRDYLKSHRECYERTQPIQDEPNRILNRVYVDLDGECPPDMPEDTFNNLTRELCEKLRAFAGDDMAVKESCKWDCRDEAGDTSNKLSFTIHYKSVAGSKKAIAHYVKSKVVPKLTAALAPFPVLGVLKKEAKKKAGDKYEGKLIVDFSVYNEGQRKMRMWGQTKPCQDRPYKILCGLLEDTFITYIPEDDIVILPEPQSVLQLAAIPAQETEPVEDDGSSMISNCPTDPTVCSENAAKGRALLRDVIVALGQHRWDYYPDWMTIAYVMFNEGFSLDELCDVSKVSKFWKDSSPAWVKSKWRQMSKGHLSGARLWKWLAEDNPDAYSELSLRREDFWGLLKAGHPQAEVARFFYNLKSDAYAYNERLGWFQLMPNNIWKRYEKTPHGLAHDIWNTLKAVADEHKSRIDMEETDETKAKIAAARLKALGSLRKSVGTIGFVDGVIRFLPRCYNDDDLDKKMDENRHLLAFSDAVYDLDKHEVRTIEPDDYICLNTGYEFPLQRHPEARDELVRTVRSVFEPDDAIKELPATALSALTSYFLKTLALTFHGRKKYEKFFVWTGTGGNGKGLLAELLKRALGSYYHSVPHQVLTKGQDKKDAPCPPLAKAKGKRACVMTEPEADDTIQVGAAKEWTGGDEITARDLHTSTITFVPQFVLYLQTNNIPKLNRVDGGIMRRMEVIPFPFKFVENPIEENQKKINIDLKDKIIKCPKWRGEMFHLLLDAYKLLQKDGLVAPREVLAKSKDYMDEQNPVLEWLTANYEIGLPKDDKRFWIEAAKLRDSFNNMTRADCEQGLFKTGMESAGVPWKKQGHDFECMRYVAEKHGDEWISSWKMAVGKATNYCVGLKKKKAPPPPAEWVE